MAKILLHTMHEENPRDRSFARGVYVRLLESFELSDRRHTLVDDPAEADIIFFAEVHVRFGRNIRRHPYYRRYPDKVFVFSIDDHCIPLLRGIYASIDKDWYLPGRCRAGFYLSAVENLHVAFDPNPAGRDLLYSFVGAMNTAPVRAKLAQVNHPRSLFLDTSQESLPMLLGGTDAERDVFWRRYAGIMRRSKFVLCPRGQGTSSIRLFETMQMGRVPVILSDDWVEPEGPRWSEISIRIPESEAASIPQILEARESEAEALGLKARAEWEKWFAPPVRFNTVIDGCLEIQKSRGFIGARIDLLRAWLQLRRPWYFRAYLDLQRRVLRERLRRK